MANGVSARSLAQLTSATGELTTAATTRMERELPWYRALSADQRAWVTLVAQAGITGFLDWLRSNATPAGHLTTDVFGAAPRELARAISLEQTVELVRTTIDVVEEAIDSLLDAHEHTAVREATLRYSREIAFSAAEVYARAAETRGAWDARLEALIIDALVRGDVTTDTHSHVQALGWQVRGGMAVIAGDVPAETEWSLDVLRRAAAHHGHDVITGVHGGTLVALITPVSDPLRAARSMSAHLGPGPVVVSAAFTTMDAAAAVVGTMARAREIAYAWPDAPRPVSWDELLPERLLAGDATARQELVTKVWRPIADDPALRSTVEVFLEQTGSLEATARALFVHPNTVRYRLQRFTEKVGYSPTDPREAYAIHLALTLGRLEDSL